MLTLCHKHAVEVSLGASSGVMLERGILIGCILVQGYKEELKNLRCHLIKKCWNEGRRRNHRSHRSVVGEIPRKTTL